MAEAWQNPYAPGMASVPPALTGRDEWLSRFDGFLKGLRAGFPVEHLCFAAPRGMGKTVLLERLGELARADGLAARRIEGTPEPSFAASLAAALGEVGSDLVSRGPRLRRLREAVEEVTLSIDAGPVKAEVRSRPSTAEQSLADLVSSLGEIAAERKRGVVLLLDEVQTVATPIVRALARGLQACAAARRPVLFATAGLPSAPEHIRTAVTYGERFRFAELEALNPVAVRVALEAPAARLDVTYRPEALDALVAAAQGYPYLVQLLGRRAWEAAQGGPTITAAHAAIAVPAALSELAANVFTGRWTQITPTERAYVVAMASLGDGEVASADIARALGRTTQNLSRIRENLISKGLLVPAGTGYLTFTLPHFARYVRERG
ncbi:MAG: ATP-binding protein [Sporichthyaceae bacterium]